MLQVEVTKTAGKPASMFRTAQPPFLSIRIVGAPEDLERLQVALDRSASDGHHSEVLAEVQGRASVIFLFRTSTLLAVVVADAGLIICGDGNAFNDLSCAANLCCSKDAVAGYHKHLEFGDPNGFAPWPQGCLTISAYSCSDS
jgi:hypothetical protein